ncbi:MAG: ABC transporter permease [Candidatus Hydrogenedentes bacterium]|nr:ABC transporter permease [Candidatus Hydrogenedentota bacterium]
MIRFLVRRVLGLVPVFLIIVTVIFFLIRLAPGGPFEQGERFVAPEALEQLRAAYNLDAPLYRQYLDYLFDLVRGDLGPSMKQPSRTVAEWIALRAPVSMELGFYALLVACTLGLLAGVTAALRPNSLTDYVPMSFAMVGICVPIFVLGPLLMLIFSIWLGWLPVAGWGPPNTKILPALTLGAPYVAYIARLARGGMFEVLAQDFIRTARAKGLSEARVVLRHALRGGIQPVVSFLGPAAAGLLTGSFVVEKVFQIPGLGSQFVDAAFNRDYTMLLGAVLFYAVLILVFNLLVDVAQALLDPRVRYGK